MSDDNERRLLLEKLAMACAVYELGDNVDAKRDAHLLSASAIYQFLIAEDFPPAALVPFQSLIYAIVSDMPRRSGLRPSSRAVVMGAAAAAVTILPPKR
jgi:hypothetical protein